MTSTGFREGALDRLVHVSASDGLIGDGLVPLIHHRQVFDVLDTLDGDTGLDPGSSPVGEVVPPFGTFVDGVVGIWEMGFHHLPSPRPGEVGQIAFLLRVLIAVHCIQRCKDTWFLHVEMGFEVEHIQQKPPLNRNGFLMLAIGLILSLYNSIVLLLFWSDWVRYSSRNSCHACFSVRDK